jgi:hypothetical protein
MRLSKRDKVATGLVFAACVLYVLWAIDSALPGMSATRATGMVVLALGFAASASAVVPTFDQLLHGSKAYLAITSVIGLVAVFGGIEVVASASSAGLAVVIVAMVLLWMIATVHHSVQTKRARPVSLDQHREFARHDR